MKRYEVAGPHPEMDLYYWRVRDRKMSGMAVLSAHMDFPDAEFLIRSQCLFLNESPALQELLPDVGYSAGQATG